MDRATGSRDDATVVEVGFLTKSGTHKNSDMTVASIAAIHEMGSADGTIPERSFMRSTMDEKNEEIENLTKKLADQVLFKNLSARKALGTLGAFIQKAFKQKINDGVEPPLKTATIRRKGSSKALVDTGQLINSIDYEVK